MKRKDAVKLAIDAKVALKVGDEYGLFIVKENHKTAEDHNNIDEE